MTTNGQVAAILPQGQRRQFTLDEAREMLPLLKSVTAKSEQELFQVLTMMKNSKLPSERRKELQRRADAVVARWGAKVARLGAVAQGLWVVDFDMGRGFYCWKHGEETVAHYHDYAAGFQGRLPLEKQEEVLPPAEEQQQ